VKGLLTNSEADTGHHELRGRLTADAVRARLTPKTRLVSLATPQNPSDIAIPRLAAKA
jgi:hypothetical protein